MYHSTFAMIRPVNHSVLQCRGADRQRLALLGGRTHPGQAWSRCEDPLSRALGRLPAVGSHREPRSHLDVDDSLLADFDAQAATLESARSP